MLLEKAEWWVSRGKGAEKNCESRMPCVPASDIHNQQTRNKNREGGYLQRGRSRPHDRCCAQFPQAVAFASHNSSASAGTSERREERGGKRGSKAVRTRVQDDSMNGVNEAACLTERRGNKPLGALKHAAVVPVP